MPVRHRHSARPREPLHPQRTGQLAGPHAPGRADTAASSRVPGTAAAGCGLWATGRVPGHGPSNIVRHGVDVKIAGLKISPGDILVCDADGVVIVPIDLAEQIIKFAKLVKAKEDETFRFFKLIICGCRTYI